MMRVSVFLIVAVTFWPAAVTAMPLPDCANEVAISRAQVLRVEKDGALILSNGRTAVLEGIRLPGTDNSDTPVAAQALQTLRKWAMSAPLVLTADEPKLDRYGRIRVQAFDHAWLQMTLLERGLARVQIAPDRQECAPDLYDAEKKARRPRPDCGRCRSTR